MFLRKNLQEYFKNQDSYQQPKMECEQLAHFNELVAFSNNKNIRLEKCQPDSNIEESQAQAYNFLIFKQAKGKTLSQQCIEKNCRGEPLKKIIKYILELLQVLNTESYIEVGNLHIDNIYFYKGMKEEYITLTDIKYNKYPDYDKQKKVFQEDLHDLGLIILQILTNQCHLNHQHLSTNNYSQEHPPHPLYMFQPQDLLSPIQIFLKVHSYQHYFYDDQDLGVQKAIYQMTEYFETRDEKNIYLQQSIYHLLYKLFNGPAQYINIQDALDHPYLKPATKL